MEFKKSEPINSGRRKFIKKGAELSGAFVAGAGAEKLGLLEKASEYIGDTFSNFIRRKTEKNNAENISAIDKIEQADYDENQIEDTEEKKTEKPKTEIELKTNADHYLKAYQELEFKPGFFPKNLFSDDFLIAQQLQESGYDKNAISPAGAVGVMQIMPICIKDDSIFLEKLHEAGVIDYQGPIYIGHLKNEKKILENPKNKSRLSEKERDARIKQLTRIITHKEEKYKERLLDKAAIDGALLLSQNNPDYSKAYGKLYHMRLFTKQRGFGIGQEEYKRGDKKGAWTKLLGCYNAGPRAAKYPKSEWKTRFQTSEPSKYVDKIFKNMDNIGKTRKAMYSSGLKSEHDNPILMRIARSMNKAVIPPKTPNYNKALEQLEEEIMHYFIDKVNIEQIRKGSPLTEAEIINIFLPFHKKKSLTKKDLI